jgi:predicted GNAT family N-acyltransferase
VRPVALPHGYRIAAVLWDGDRSGAERVRRRVFVEEQRIPEPEEWDAADPLAHHLVAFDHNGEPVGTGRLETCGKIGRIAVLPGHRGRGLGAALVLHLVNHATELGLGSVYLHAQTAAAAFYARLGFHAEGPVFDEVGIPHQRMTLGISSDDEHEAGTDGRTRDPLDAR